MLLLLGLIKGFRLIPECNGHWKVKVWTESENESQRQPIASWIMGIFHGYWEGEWIGELSEVSFQDRFPVPTELQDCPIGLEKAARRKYPHGPSRK